MGDVKKSGLVKPAQLPEVLEADWNVLAEMANEDGEVVILNPDAVSENRLAALFGSGAVTPLKDEVKPGPDGFTDVRQLVVRVESDKPEKASASQMSAARDHTFAAVAA